MNTPRRRENDETRKLPDMGAALAGIDMGYQGAAFMQHNVRKPLTVDAGKPHVKVIPKSTNDLAYYEKKDAFGDTDQSRTGKDSRTRNEINRGNSLNKSNTTGKNTIKIDSQIGGAQGLLPSKPLSNKKRKKGKDRPDMTGLEDAEIK